MTQSQKYIEFSSIVFQLYISILSCFFDLPPVESHKKARALTVKSDNHLQSAACFESLKERPNVKCIRKFKEGRMGVILPPPRIWGYCTVGFVLQVCCDKEEYGVSVLHTTQPFPGAHFIMAKNEPSDYRDYLPKYRESHYKDGSGNSNTGKNIFLRKPPSPVSI